MRLIDTQKHESNTVKTYYDYDNNEYACQLHGPKGHCRPADYFTDSKDDALGTAKRMALNGVAT